MTRLSLLPLLLFLLPIYFNYYSILSQSPAYPDNELYFAGNFSLVAAVVMVSSFTRASVSFVDDSDSDSDYVSVSFSFLNSSLSTPLDDGSDTSSPDDCTFSRLNLSSIYPLRYALPLLGYAMPLLLVVTLVANSLIVIVLSKPLMRTPTNVLLMSMALSDMFTLLFPAPWLFYLYTLGYHVVPLSSPRACYAFVYMHEVIPALFHTASIWLTLGLALQRYISVCHPPLARVWCTVSRVRKGVVLIYALAFLHQSTRFFDRVITTVRLSDDPEGEASACCETTADWVHLVDENIYYNIYYWFRVLFVHVVPCTALVLLNILLLRAMHESQLRRVKLFSQDKSDGRRDSSCTTLMLVTVVSVFLSVETPLAVITLLHIVSSSFGVDVLDYKVASVLILFINFFIVVSYPINFAIYCGMSRQFRVTFKALFFSSDGDETHCERTSRDSLVNGPRTCTNETVL